MVPSGVNSYAASPEAVAWRERTARQREDVSRFAFQVPSVTLTQADEDRVAAILKALNVDD